MKWNTTKLTTDLYRSFGRPESLLSVGVWATHFSPTQKPGRHTPALKHNFLTLYTLTSFSLPTSFLSPPINRWMCFLLLHVYKTRERPGCVCIIGVFCFFLQRDKWLSRRQLFFYFNYQGPPVGSVGSAVGVAAEFGAPPAACDLMRCTLLLSIAFPLGPTTTTTATTRNNRHEKWTDHQNPLHQWPLLPRNSIGEIVAKWANKIKMYSNANSLSWHNGQWNVILGGIGAAPVSSFFYFLSDLRASRKKQNFSAGMCAIFMERILVHPPLSTTGRPPTPRLFTTPFLIKIRKEEEEEEEFLLLGFLWNFLNFFLVRCGVVYGMFLF